MVGGVIWTIDMHNTIDAKCTNDTTPLTAVILASAINLANN